MRKLLIAAGITVLIAMVAFAFAESEILSTEGDTVKAGDSLRFRIDLEKIDIQEFGPYEIAFAITPEEPRECFDFKENIDVKFNVVNGAWSVASDELMSLKELNGTVSPHAGLDKETEYTVTVTISGRDKVTEEKFVFTAIPNEKKPEEKPADKPPEEPLPKESEKIETGSAAGGGGGEEPDPAYVYHGSANNYLEKLDISGHELSEKFNKTRNIYFVDVTEDVKSVNVNAVPADKSAQVNIAGNSNVGEEMSRIVVKVTAANGDERSYRVYVRQKKKKKQ